ncbi:TIGR02678 family protein [Burkholderia oklahomensis]|uniref:TIGR02678 family protein n=1 Tax=Burkholderia oklahomensis TaxID=342113 RepID=UPI00265283CD|nr:TIGR02678 family protein [Burkholderia oklahomensis]MDN7671853.1 TIGR02678 family protein [Burkholderia oklahomensis]
MTARTSWGHDRQRIGELQRVQQQDEFRRALRALLLQPLMAPDHDAFPAVRRQAERLRDWFARETGWPLHVERDGARLFKRPANLADDTRGLPNFDRQRYVLLCLACAVLERADPQITLQLLGERLMQLASDPTLVSCGFQFTLGSVAERRDLVAVCRTLLDFGVLQRVAGDEDNFVHENGWTQSDALYDVQRRMLAGMLAAVRGPSTWRVEDAPIDFEDRLRSLVAEHVADSEQGHRDALRHHLARRLLDDPVIYGASLDPEHLAYFINQRGAMAARLCEATGLTTEQRAEGLALTDESGELTDISMPAEGTEAHVTLLVAEFLASRQREVPEIALTSQDAVAAFLRGATEQYGRYWRKSAREPGAEMELAEIALDRLERLQLIVRIHREIRPLPAIARFALGNPEIRSKATGDVTPELLPIDA